MRCWGRTSLKRRCRNDSHFLLCHHHWYQPFILLFTLTTIYVTTLSLYNSIFSKKLATKEDTESIEDLINKRFSEFKVPDIDSDQEYPGVSVSIVLKLIEQYDYRRKYIFDIAQHLDNNRISLYLDAENILTFQLIDNKGETYNVKISPNEFTFNKFLFFHCEYGITQEFSFLRIFINNNLVEQTKFKFIIKLPKDFKRHSTIMADILGKNNTSMTVAFYSTAHVVFGKIKRRGFYNSVKKYLIDIDHPFSLEE